jgi:hypothetical protein
MKNWDLIDISHHSLIVTIDISHAFFEIWNYLIEHQIGM